MEIFDTKPNPKNQSITFSPPPPTAKDPLAQEVTLLKIKKVCDQTATPKSTIYRKIANGEFPKPIKLGKHAVAWRSDEVQEWINSRERSNIGG